MATRCIRSNSCAWSAATMRLAIPCASARTSTYTERSRPVFWQVDPLVREFRRPLGEATNAPLALVGRQRRIQQALDLVRGELLDPDGGRGNRVDRRGHTNS